MYTLRCNITSNATLFYNTSYAEMDSNVTINRTLIINIINVDQSTIYRNDSFSPYESNISIHVNDASIGDKFNATVRFYNSSGMFLHHSSSIQSLVCQERKTFLVVTHTSLKSALFLGLFSQNLFLLMTSLRPLYQLCTQTFIARATPRRGSASPHRSRRCRSTRWDGIHYQPDLIMDTFHHIYAEQH